jgi:DNA-binding GntR family transcriptional regulator
MSHALAERRSERSGRVEQAYLALRELIVNGRLAPGAALIETQLANQLGFRRTTLRSALQRLQQERYVVAAELGQYSRSMVAPLTAGDMQELWSIIGGLEGVAARMAAELGVKRRTEVAKELARLNAGLLGAARSSPRDMARVNQFHLRFHRHHVEVVAGPRLRAELDAMHAQAERYERLYTNALIGDLATSCVEHEAIIEAIGAGDPDAAQAGVEANWRNGARRFARLIAEVGERGII